MIKYHKDFPDLPKLQLDQGIYVTSGIQKERDLYGKLALMQSYPFRSLEDLKGNGNSYWTQYIYLRDKGFYHQQY